MVLFHGLSAAMGGRGEIFFFFLMGWERFLLVGFPGPIRGRIGEKGENEGKWGKMGVGAFVIAKW